MDAKGAVAVLWNLPVTIVVRYADTTDAYVVRLSLCSLMALLGIVCLLVIVHVASLVILDIVAVIGVVRED